MKTVDRVEAEFAVLSYTLKTQLEWNHLFISKLHHKQQTIIYHRDF